MRLMCRAVLCCAGIVAATVAAVDPPAGGAGLPVAAAVELTATALIMGATTQTLSVPPATPEYIRDYVTDRYRDYLAPTGLCTGGEPGCALVAVYGPEELGPFTGLLDLTADESVAAGRTNLDACIRGDSCMITAAPYSDTDESRLSDTVYLVSGASQSAVIVSYEKAALIADPVEGRSVSFVVTSSPSRPNGGLFARFPGGSIPFIGMTFAPATPTDSARDAPMFTVDIARQYDGWDDFPINPLNALATANALLGTLFLHAEPLHSDGPLQLQGYYQDTTYYLAPTAVLPLLVPLAAVPVVGMPMAKLLDAPLRVLVEAGYDRALNPGQPAAAQWLYAPNPVRTLVDLAVAIPTGWDDAIAHVTGDLTNRPFNTLAPGPYGVGGPPVFAGAVDPYQPGVPTTPSPDPKVSPAADRTPSALTALPAVRSANTAAKPDESTARSVRSSAARPAAAGR